jgi:hypothetical protein
MNKYYSLLSCNHAGHQSWWEYDHNMVALFRVCKSCRAAKLDAYDGVTLNTANLSFNYGDKTLRIDDGRA